MIVAAQDFQVLAFGCPDGLPQRLQFSVDAVEHMLFDGPDGVKAGVEPVEREPMLAIGGMAGNGQKRRRSPVGQGRIVREVAKERKCGRASPCVDGKQDEFGRPVIEIREAGFIKRRDMEAAGGPCLHQALASQSVERVAYGRHARGERRGQRRRIEPVARPKFTAHDAEAQRLMDPFGGRSGVHGASRCSCA